MSTPRHIILSRKSVDSAAGRLASPILDGRLVPLPIPSPDIDKLTYGRLNTHALPIGKIVSDLSEGRWKSASKVHLDPDLEASNLPPRSQSWRPLFGQAGAADAHLRNQQVSHGDLFLFFARFREAELYRGTYRYKPDAAEKHIIYGWLQIDHIIDEPKECRLGWAKYHPHIDEPRGRVFVSATKLSLNGRETVLPGAGQFKAYSDALCLTAPSSKNRRLWRLPSWVRPRNGVCPLTYHPDPESYEAVDGHIHLTSACRGQEFVLDVSNYPESIQWAASIIQHGATSAHPAPGLQA